MPEDGIFVNFLYFITINLIMTGVISGIILATFADIRAKNDELLNDTNDRCFICSIDRDDFDNANENFKKHIERDHSMWSYLFFRVYLKRIDVTDMTGQESYIW